MMIKRVSLALVALGLSASAYAVHPVEEMLPAAPPVVAVTIPQQTGSWAIGVEALYQALGNGDYHYATSADVAVDVVAVPLDVFVDVDAKVHNVKPKYGWGWEVDAAYLFPGNGRDVELSWKHLHKSHSNTVDIDGDTVLVGPALFTPAIFGVIFGDDFFAGWDVAEGKTNYKYDHVDLVFGQKMDFAQKVTLRAFGGLRYADIRTKESAEYFVVDDIGDFLFLETTQKSNFQGLGPRAGVDAKVRVGGNFSVVGTFAGSLLAGPQKKSAALELNFFDVGTDLFLDVDASASVGKKTIVVPELDSRLGVNFAWAFNPDAAVEFELGYEAINYFGVKDSGSVSFVDTTSNDNNFAIRGPYFRVQLNIA